MNTTPDGQFQTYSTETGAYIREHFFGADPRLRKMVEHLTDDQLRNLSRGGHDYRKVYAAFKAATEHDGQPTVILAHTIKGWTLGKDFEGRNATHQMKKLTKAELKEIPRPALPARSPTRQLEDGLPPYYHPGRTPRRSSTCRSAGPRSAARAAPGRPGQAADAAGRPRSTRDLKKGSGKQAVATTMAFVRLLKDLMKDKEIGQRFVPIIPDEARTFGMDSMFPTAKIYSPLGQQYDSVDRELLLSYKEATNGPDPARGHHRGRLDGARSIAAGTSYATHGEPMIPVYVFYSMFGFQRTGDQIWRMADQLGRGFVLGATAGPHHAERRGAAARRTGTRCCWPRPTRPASPTTRPSAFEIAYIVEDGLRRMYGSTDEHPHGEDVFYYLTVYNEPYQQPAMPEHVDAEGIRRGIYRYKAAPSRPTGRGRRSSPPAWRCSAALEAQQMLADGVGRRGRRLVGDLLERAAPRRGRRPRSAALLHPSVPSAGAVRDARRCPGPAARSSRSRTGCARCRTRSRAGCPGDYSSLGTDGFGRSDTRGALRRYFHIDAESIVVAVLSRLAASGEVKQETLQQAVDSLQADRRDRGRRRQHRRRHLRILAAAVAGRARPHRLHGR